MLVILGITIIAMIALIIWLYPILLSLLLLPVILYIFDKINSINQIRKIYKKPAFTLSSTCEVKKCTYNIHGIWRDKTLLFIKIITLIGLMIACLALLDVYKNESSHNANKHRAAISTLTNKGRTEPDFREVQALESTIDTTQVAYGDRGMTLGFPSSMADDDISTAIKSNSDFEKLKQLPRYMRFYGWKYVALNQVNHGSQLYSVMSGLLLMMGGATAWYFYLKKNT